MQHTRRCIAPMQRETDATHNASRCNVHIAYRTAHPVPHAPWRHGAAAWLQHIACLDACTLPLGNLATRCMTSARASCSARRARAAVQHSASRWGRPFGNGFETSTHTLHSGRMRRTPCTARRSMRAPHRARHPSAVPHRATYHTTARGRATRAGRTHRLAVRDRAALERDGAIVHANHAAVTLRTAGAAAPTAIGRAPRLPTPAPLRIAAPPRTHRCGAGYRHGVEQRGALAHGEHAAAGLRTSASRRRSAAAKARPSPNRAAHTRSRHHTTQRTRRPRVCNMQRATRADATCNTHRCNTPTRADATRYARRYILQHATRTDATCNARRCTDATRTDAT
jgi:hypothetical protein